MAITSQQSDENRVDAVVVEVEPHNPSLARSSAGRERGLLLESNKEGIQIGAYAVTNPSGAQDGNLQLTNAVPKSGTKLLSQLVVGQTFESVTLDIQTTSNVSKGHSKTSYLQYTLTSAAVEASKVTSSSDWVISLSFGNIAHLYGVTVLPTPGQIEVSKSQDSASGNLYRAV